MISVLAQERLLGAALGSLLTGGVVFELRRSIYKSINQYEPQENLISAMNFHFFVLGWVLGSARARSEVVRTGSKVVDYAASLA
ncbi:hypothetical protein SASPL_122511 [Salvia splendens]|uniref:Uncharacterized protein n=1 Tax=Salvia splendens TaxID=180675 RepID=A0A8X8ZT24_SALSN|nr:hypothetical protein SASPL_122511 [Salvia splendens]